MSSLTRSVYKTSGFDQLQDPTQATTRLIFPATIVDAIAWTHCYVISADRQPLMVATAGSATSLSIMSQRWHGMYSPGTHVLCYRLTPDRVIIIGAYGDDVGWAKTNISDWLLMHSGVGFKDDLVHQYLTTLPDAAGIRNFNASRPADVVSGEAGLMNTLGVGLHLSLLTAALRAGGMSSIECFYPDDLVRISARNLQLWTGTREEWCMDDEGELNEIITSTAYPQEMLGALALKTATTRDGSGEWKKGQNDAAWEPTAIDQTGIWRLLRFNGYLGGATRTLVVCPSTDFTDKVETLGSGNRYIGLSEQIAHDNGQLSFRSAKGILLQKTLQIPVPRQVKAPDAGDGDSRDGKNYNFAGQSGTGPAHNKHEFPYAGKPAARHMELLNAHAWILNNYSQVAFDKHKQDWSVWQESNSPFEDSEGQPGESALFNPLGNKFSGSLPESLSVKIDNRPGHTHKYYRGKACVELCDDGRVVIEDCWGSSIVLAGGNIYLTCQGDIISQPGRSSITLAPKDVVLRAGSDLELSAALGDVRIKAEKNAHVLAGNSGVGGIMLESRAAGFSQDYSQYGDDVKSSGIALVAKSSQVISYSKDMYVRTLDGGSMTLDCDRGNGNMRFFYNQRLETAQSGFEIAYGTVSDSQIPPTAVELHTSAQVVMGQSQIITNAVSFLMPTLGASLIVNGRIYARDGFVHNIPDFPYVFGPWGPELESYVNSQTTYIAQEIASPLTQQLETLGQTLYQSETAIGGEILIKRIGYSCRTDDQYKLTDFELFETRWQQQFRAAGNGKLWQEPIVHSPDGAKQTLPWPGYDSWRVSPNFGTVDGFYYDPNTLISTDRTGEPPKTAAINKATPDSRYLVNFQR